VSIERVLVRLVLVISGLMLLWMARPLLTGTIPFTGDLLHFHYPLRDFYARALASGHRFDWMPELFAGFYVTGEGQLGPYHPLHLVLYRLLPLDTAFGIELVAAYPFMFAGAWLFLRRWCDRAPAAFGAMLCTFSAFTLSHGVHPNMVSIVAHVPWLLWAIHQAVATAERPVRKDRPYIAAPPSVSWIALLTGSQLLLGHPQAVWLSLLIELAYVLFLLAARLTAVRGLGAVLGSTVLAGKALGIGIGAVQLVATFEAMQHSTRSPGDDAFATTFALAPMQLLQLLHPYLFWQRIGRWTEAPGAGDEFAAYGGAVALVLAAWWVAGMFRRRDGGPPEGGHYVLLARWSALLAVFGMWMAIGARGGLYLLQTWLPLVGRFRVPARFVFVTQFGLAILAAIALMHLMRRDDRGPGARTLWAPWSVAALSLVSAAWLVLSDRVAVQGSTAMMAAAAGPVLLVFAALLLTLAVRGARWAIVGLVLLAAGDQAVYGLAGVVAWQDTVTRSEAEGFLDTGNDVPPGPARIAHGGFPNLYTLAGYRALDGYAGMTPARTLDYRVPQALRAAQVGYAHAEFQARAQVPGAEELPHGWYRLPAPVARARLVGRSRTSRHPAADIATIDVDGEALVARDVFLGGGAAGTAQITRDEPGRIEVRTDAGARQLLVVSESFDAGWVATIDGREATVEQVNGDFLGSVVPAGRHDIALTFSPRFLAMGKWISMAAVFNALLRLAAAYRASNSNR
jgi:hypothetical protein